MSDDALESVLRLVAEGRLTAAEAAPILDALAATAAPASESAGPSAGPADTPAGGPGRAIRLEVTDGGRQVVNLRVPLALGRAAIAQVPGLSEATVDRLRDAIDAGLTGPVLDIAGDDGTGDAVRVVIE